MAKGGQPGNTNAAKGRVIRDAFNRAFDMHKPVDQRIALDAVVASVIAEAQNGNMVAAKEIFDRLEGKPIQQTEVSGPDGGDIIARIERVITDPKNVNPSN